MLRILYLVLCDYDELSASIGTIVYYSFKILWLSTKNTAAWFQQDTIIRFISRI